jgi:hypothetical protein
MTDSGLNMSLLEALDKGFNDRFHVAFADYRLNDMSSWAPTL